MPHQVHLRTLGRTSGHRSAMLRNLAVSVLRYERVRTTEAKAKEVRRFVERAIALGRDGSLLARRRAGALLHDRLIVEKVFDDLAKRYPARVSGFTRLTHLGRRVGDGAPLMLVELVEASAGADGAGQPVAEKAAEPAAEAKGPAAGVRELARRVTRARTKTEPKAEEKSEAKKRAVEGKAEARKPRAKKMTEPSEKKTRPAARKKKEKE